jgi:hypothetical protein
MRQQGRQYARMLSLAVPRMRIANPQARVGIMARAGPADSIGVSLQGIVDDGRGRFDVVAVHA